MAGLVRNRSSGRQRLRQGYVGKNFQLEGRQYVVEDVIAEGKAVVRPVFNIVTPPQPYVMMLTYYQMF